MLNVARISVYYHKWLICGNGRESAHPRVPSFRLHAAKMMRCMVQTEILPYYFLIVVYMVIYSPSLPHPHEAVGSAILKILPIWYLVLYVHRRSPDGTNPSLPGVAGQVSNQAETPDMNDNQVSNGHILTERTRSWITGSVPCLIISSIGDVCLVYKGFFLVGVFFFSIVHVLYLFAMRKLYRTSNKAWLALPLCCLLYCVILLGINDSFFKVVVLVYAILIHSMLFFAISSYESYPCSSTICYMLGASLFVTSDFLIACNKWLYSTPQSELTILSTYYLAQALLTVASC
jgi:uncharacterized membrane protein YhhN